MQFNLLVILDDSLIIVLPALTFGRNFIMLNNMNEKTRKIPTITRSSRLEVFCREGVLRNFVKFTGKHLCHSLFFNKVAGLRPAM